jgi:hypothetical protein
MGLWLDPSLSIFFFIFKKRNKSPIVDFIISTEPRISLNSSKIISSIPVQKIITQADDPLR